MATVSDRVEVYNRDAYSPAMESPRGEERGPRPGERAPDVDLPTTEPGARFSLGARPRERPVLVTFGALTCPYTFAALPALRALHAVFSERIDLVTVYVREMHPGERRPQPGTLHEKMRRAREWQRLDAIPWTVAVDRLDGEVHRAFGLLPAPAFLVDSKGRIAFRACWAGERRALRAAMERVLDAEGFGVEVPCGERERSPLARLRGAVALDIALSRGGERARREHRAACGRLRSSAERFAGSLLADLFRPTHRRAA